MKAGLHSVSIGRDRWSGKSIVYLVAACAAPATLSTGRGSPIGENSCFRGALAAASGGGGDPERNRSQPLSHWVKVAAGGFSGSLFGGAAAVPAGLGARERQGRP